MEEALPIPNPVFLYCVEILPRLKSVQISLLTDYHNLSLSKESIVITNPEGRHESQEGDSDDHLIKYPSLCSCKLDLTCHSPLQFASGILSLKTKALDPLPSTPPPYDFLRACNNPSAVSLLCGFCNSKLTRPENPFKRVLPLPSESWDEFSGGIFCHHHEGDKHGKSEEDGCPVISPSTFKITPKDGDCLYSTSTILLTEKLMEMGRVHKDPASRNIHCSRCLMFLGSPIIANGIEEHLSTDSAPVSLLRSNVKVSLPNESYSHLPPVTWLENHFALRLYSFTQSEMAFRYFVKDHNGYCHLHVWMLNVCSELSCNSNPKVYCKFSGCDKSKANNRRVLKLLFKCDTEEVKGESSLDSGMELETDACLSLKVLLADSNRSLPPAQRRASGYNVGYLHFSAHS